MIRHKKKGGRKKRFRNTRTVSIKPKGILKELGPIIDITYRWADDNHYIHTFDSHSQPLLVYDENGKLFIIDGKYTVSDEKGIIDL